jgi:hypothetical protein
MVKLWLVFYEKPEKQKKLSAAELAYITSGEEEITTESTQEVKKVSWFKLLGYKQTWAFAFGKFMTMVYGGSFYFGYLHI